MDDFIQVMGNTKYTFRWVLVCEEEEVSVESDDDIFEEIKEEDYFKMNALLDHIEQGDLEGLKTYIAAGHPAVKMNHRSTISSLTDALLEEMYHNASQKQIRDTGARVREMLNSQTPNINHLAKRFSKIRKVLAARFGEKSTIYKWHKRNGGLEYEQFVDKQQMQNLNRDNRLANLTRVDEKDVHEILNRTSAADDVYDNIIALQIATGARFIEAVRVSSFKKVPYSSNVVKIVGVAKKGKEGEKFEVDRPIFGLDIDELLDLQKHVRRELKQSYPQLDKLDNEQVTKLLNGTVNKHIKALHIEGVNSSHDLRKVFGAITHAELPEENRKAIDRHLHIKNVLGHAKLETAGNYANVRIKKSRNKLKSTEDVEKKLDEVDRVNNRQDENIKELQENPVPIVTGPEIKTAVENRTQIFKMQNANAESVTIVDDYPRIRGNAVNRAVNLMEQMRDNSVIITEKYLKLMGIGSNTIAQVAARKRELNDEILAELRRV